VLENIEVIAAPKPMLASSGRLPPDSDRYAFEVKWDGFRALVSASPAGVTITSRNGYDMTSRYPDLDGLSHVVLAPVLLDGEIVALDANGRPDFAALWFRSRTSADPGARLCFMAFDVLELDGEALIDRPYRERRGILEELSFAGPNWGTPEAHIREGAALFAATKRMGLEGVVAKRLDSLYRPGIRSRAWTKMKHWQERTFALLGWLPPEEWRGDRGCVVLGLRTPDGITVSGVVESGYDRELVDRLPQLSRRELREFQKPGHTWTGATPLLGALFGLLAGSITSMFIERDQGNARDDRLDEIGHRLDRIEQLLSAAGKHGGRLGTASNDVGLRLDEANTPPEEAPPGGADDEAAPAGRREEPHQSALATIAVSPARTRAMGPQMSRSSRLLEMKFVTAPRSSRPATAHVAQPATDTGIGDASNPAPASTISAASTQTPAATALATRMLRGRRSWAPPHAARPRGAPTASATWNAAIPTHPIAASTPAHLTTSHPPRPTVREVGGGMRARD
jgi:hypothetical protein